MKSIVKNLPIVHLWALGPKKSTTWHYISDIIVLIIAIIVGIITLFFGGGIIWLILGVLGISIFSIGSTQKKSKLLELELEYDVIGEGTEEDVEDYPIKYDVMEEGEEDVKYYPIKKYDVIEKGAEEDVKYYKYHPTEYDLFDTLIQVQDQDTGLFIDHKDVSKDQWDNITKGINPMFLKEDDE